MAKAEDWRPLIAQIADQYVTTPGGAPPYPVIEAQIDIESGGDPATVSPSGAVGLGQIMRRGLEYGYYQQNPQLTAQYGQHPDLLDPRANLEIMIYGMDQRQESGLRELQAGNPGAYADWYMSAAGYLGGANQEGFTSASDSYGTTGSLYVRRIRQYIQARFGRGWDEGIDDLQPGSARIAGGNWDDPNAAITWRPDVPANALADLDRPPDGRPDIAWEGEAGLGIGLDDVPLVGDELAGLRNAIGGIIDATPGFLARAGLFAAGLVLLAVGVKVSL